MIKVGKECILIDAGKNNISRVVRVGKWSYEHKNSTF